MQVHLKKILAKPICLSLVVFASAGIFSPGVQAAQQPLRSYNLDQATEFIVADVRLQGLQRVSAGTVFNIIPVSVGDRVDNVAVRQITRALFASGYFNDIRIARDGSVLIVTMNILLTRSLTALAMTGRSLAKRMIPSRRLAAA